jgi:hypothetical protein
VVTLDQLPVGPSVGAAAAVLILGRDGVAAAAAVGVLMTVTGTVGGLCFAAWASADKLWSVVAGPGCAVLAHELRGRLSTTLGEPWTSPRGSPNGRVGHSISTITLPVFPPVNSRFRASGACSKPLTMWVPYLIFPPATQAPISVWAALVREGIAGRAKTAGSRAIGRRRPPEVTDAHGPPATEARAPHQPSRAVRGCAGRASANGTSHRGQAREGRRRFTL